MTGHTIGCFEAEAAVLGALLLLPASEAAKVAPALEIEDFVDPRHRVVFEAVLALLAEGAPADAVTVLGHLRRTGAERSMTADRSAGSYLADLLAAVPTVVSVPHYTRIVVEHRARRRLAEAAERLLQAAGATSLATAEEVAREEWAAVLHQIDRANRRPAQEVR